jgi:Transposase DDE domain
MDAPILDPAMPFKANASRRHHIPRQKRRVTNWAAYDASLRQRGSLTVWFTDEAIATWQAAPRTTRGGQPWYSPLAILTGLRLRAVFRLALRQTEGLIGSIIHYLPSWSPPGGSRSFHPQPAGGDTGGAATALRHQHWR